jgi:hypothetical protein
MDHSFGSDEAYIPGCEFKPVMNEKNKEIKTLAGGVCKIFRNNCHAGTGFLSDIFGGSDKRMKGVFTCFHVISSLDELYQFNFLFEDINYRLTLQTSDVEWFADQGLDFVFLSFNQSVLDELAEFSLTFLPISDVEEPTGFDVFIIQYPEYEPQSTAQGKLISYEEAIRIQNDRGQVGHIKQHDWDLIYLVSTLYGSSGSPILNMKNEVVGIHKSGMSLHKDQEQGLFNAGTKIQCVIRAIEELKRHG